MARPQKEGLDYFPLDVDIADDDKMELIEAKYGLIGFGVTIRLLMRIYKNGYYYSWTEKEQLLFAKRVDVDINVINDIINDAVKWELFDDKMLKKHEVLTSKGIQKRYLEAVKRRQKVEMLKKYLLLNGKCLNEYNNIDIVDINSVDDDINPQRKVKESKEKKAASPLPSTEAEQVYIVLFEKKYGQKPEINWARDRKILNDIIGNRGLPETINLITAYFKTKDKYVIENGHPLPLLKSSINQLLAEMKSEADDKKVIL